jgi:hypothetical protein
LLDCLIDDRSSRPRRLRDDSGWEDVYKGLKRDCYNVSIVQNPTISFPDDVAATKRACMLSMTTSWASLQWPIRHLMWAPNGLCRSFAAFSTVYGICAIGAPINTSGKHAAARWVIGVKRC